MSSDLNPKHHVHQNFESQHPLHDTGHGDLKFHSQMHKMSAEEHRELWAQMKRQSLHSKHVPHDFHIHEAGSNSNAREQGHHINGHNTTHLHHDKEKAPSVHQLVEENKKGAPVIKEALTESVPKTMAGPHDYQLPPGFADNFSPADKTAHSVDSSENKANPEAYPNDAAPGVEASKKDILNQAIDLSERLMKAVALNEGTFTTVTKNDMHHGLSVGIRQWNQKGELPVLLHDWHEKDPAKFDAIFGKYSRDALNPNWIYRARHLGYDKNFMGKMNTALADTEFQQVQVDNSKHFAQQAVARAKSLGLHSELGAAMVADFTNQMGNSGSAYAFSRVGLHEGGEVKNEAEVLQKLGKMTRRPNAKARMEEITSIFSPQKLIDTAPAEPKV